MHRWIVVALLCFAAPGNAAASSPRQDALLDGYFAIWDRDAAITPDNVARLYGRRIIYYGHLMTRADLYREKLGFVRAWPVRHYEVEPGTASRRCDAAETTCVFSSVLQWRRAGAGGVRSGRSRVSLTVAPDDGGMKIVREGAVTLTP